MDLVPPPELVDAVGAGPFKLIGEAYLQHFVTLAGLQPHHRVLDVGSGSGRMAVPLTHYFSAEGEYEGFDIVRDGVQWCQENITPRYPNFRFHLANVYNQHYNPAGQSRASEYRFPYPEASFDFVFLVSVFTHMLPADLEQYLAETARVLKPGGRCLITFFLLNDESLELMHAGCSNMDFRQGQGIYRAADPANPEAAVAYEQSYVEGLFKRCGLQIGTGMHLGAWCGRQTYVDWQDIVVAARAPVLSLGLGTSRGESLKASSGLPIGKPGASFLRESRRLAVRAVSALRHGGPGRVVIDVRDYLRWRITTRRPRI